MTQKTGTDTEDTHPRVNTQLLQDALIPLKKIYYFV